MKNFKQLIIIALITFFSCSSSDDSETTPTTLEIKTTIDLSALAKLTGNDATALIKFNGVAADQYTTDALIGDKVTYTIRTNEATTIVRLTNYQYASGSDDLWAFLEKVNQAGWLVGLEVKKGAEIDQVIKFNISFQLEVNGVLQTQKTYLIDPKIRIRSKRPANVD